MIDSIDGFNDAVEKITQKIISQEYDLRSLAENAGYMEEDIDVLTTFLATSKKTLYFDVKKMLNVIFSDPSHKIEFVY